MSMADRLTAIQSESNLARARAMLGHEVPAARHIVMDAARAPTAAAMQPHIDNLEVLVEMLTALQSKLA